MTPYQSFRRLFVCPKRICILLGTFQLICFSECLHAQTAGEASKDATDKKSYWKFTAGYLTNSVYNGRQDSLPIPYLTPEIGYFDKSGFYISGSLSFLLDKNTSRLDVSTLNAGYQFNISDKFSGEVYASKSWYNQTSSNIKSDIKGSAGSSLSYDLNIIQVNGGVDVVFAQKTDYALNVGLSHSFEFKTGADVFSVEPSFTTNWSTLHSYEGYINRKVKKKRSAGLPAGTVITSQTAVQKDKLTLLDYEVSLPLSFETPKVGFSVTPTFAIPQNPIFTNTIVTTKLPNGTQTVQSINSTEASEMHLLNRFYVEFSCFIKF